MEDQHVSLKNISSLGYNVIVTVYQTDAFKAGIKFDNNGKLLIIHEGRVICSFHAKKSENEEGKSQQLLARRNMRGDYSIRNCIEGLREDGDVVPLPLSNSLIPIDPGMLVELSI